MKKTVKLISVVLCFVLFLSCQFVPNPNKGSSSGNDALSSRLESAFHSTVVTRNLSRNPVQTYNQFKSREVIDSSSISDRVVSRTMSASQARSAGASVISVIVNQTLYSQITPSIQLYLQDLQNSGYQVILHTLANDGKPVDLKNILINDYRESAIHGAVLVGNLPVAWYEMHDVWDNWFNQFPCDYYFMDLDGVWTDTDNNSIFDGHSGADKADIWVARIKADEIVDSAHSEESLIGNYFRKNHDYRTGALRLNDSSISVINQDWNNQGFENQIALAYPQSTVLKDPIESVTADAFVQNVSEANNKRFESLLVAAHSNSQVHSFYSGGFYSGEIEQRKIQVNFYNLFACSSARFTDLQNLGEWYTFQSQYGLNVVGTTKTGSMLMFDYFYRPLSEGNTLGDAFLSWFQNVVSTSIDSQSWFYGMTMLGDPTLKASRFMPASNNTPPPFPTPTASPAVSPVPNPTPVASAFKTFSYNIDTAPSINRIHSKIKILNTGTSNVALNQLTLRYFYTADNDAAQVWNNEFAEAIVNGVYQEITASVNASIQNLSVARPLADRYVEIGFTSSNVVLTPGSYAVVQFGINNASWLNYNQTNDYSFLSTARDFLENQAVVAYQGNSLVSGTLP